MESNDVAPPLQLANVIKGTVLLMTKWRIVKQHVEAQFPAPTDNDGPDVSYTDHAQGQAFGRDDAAGSHPSVDSAENPLRYSGRVATWRIAHGDVVGGAIVKVDMVGADGCRADEAHAATLEQRGITTGASTDNQGIGITHGSSGNVLRLHVQDLGTGFYQSVNVGNMAIYNDFHDNRLTAAEARHTAMNKSMNT